MQFRLSFAYHGRMGEMKRAIAQEQRERQLQDRFASTLVIATSVIAAVRLAREEISEQNPRVRKAITESLYLAEQILYRIAR